MRKWVIHNSKCIKHTNKDFKNSQMINSSIKVDSIYYYIWKDSNWVELMGHAPLADSNDIENWIKILKWKACILSSKYEDSLLMLLKFRSRIDLSAIWMTSTWTYIIKGCTTKYASVLGMYWACKRYILK